MPMIRVDEEVYAALGNKGTAADSYNDVLRRELSLPDRRVHELRRRGVMKSDKQDLNDLMMTVDRHLPGHWSQAHTRMYQILRVVAGFMNAPSNLSTAEPIPSRR